VFEVALIVYRVYTLDMSNPTPTAGTSSRKESIMDLLLRTSVIHPDHGVVTVELDAEGIFPGVYPLTQCCEAAASGIADYVGCKGCYQPVPEWFGSFAKDLNGLKATFA
tara:strand:- start:97 stop:423 length:327 start_codon:yes stop_codon:yes gene_type:complete